MNIEVRSKEFGRIATQNAKNVILQKIREEERKVLFDEYYRKSKRCGNRYRSALYRQECKHQPWQSGCNLNRERADQRVRCSNRPSVSKYMFWK